ncbi:MAG: metallophosphoesterase [Ktedonobacterales bacterium]
MTGSVFSTTPTSHTAPSFAVIADIHGNVPALDAVLADLERVQPDLVIVAGDFVNRGPQSRATLERIAPYGFPAISGNHDTWLALLARGEGLPASWDSPWWTPVRLATADLTPQWLAWIDALPPTLRLELPGTTPALIVHGSPRHSREGMGRMMDEQRLREALAGVTEPTVIGAHIHYPYERWVERTAESSGEQGEPLQLMNQRTHVVVVGAVGCPFNGDLNAQYGLFTWAGEDWRFEHRSVPYDHAPIYAAWRENGYLADDSLASELMLLEYQTARTHYVPFWEWAEAQGLPFTHASYARFAAERDPMPPPLTRR